MSALKRPGTPNRGCEGSRARSVSRQQTAGAYRQHVSRQPIYFLPPSTSPSTRSHTSSYFRYVCHYKSFKLNIPNSRIVPQRSPDLRSAATSFR